MNTSEFYNNGISSLNKSNLFESFDKNVSNLDGNISFNDQFKPLLFDNKGTPKPKNITHNSFIKRLKSKFIFSSISLYDLTSSL
mgnify:CR=1 FL=1